MPWSQVTVKQKREEFVGLASQPDANVSELCRRFEISRKTGYKWLQRTDLDDRSRRPKCSPCKMPDQREALVVALRAKHPAWGGRKLAHVLERDHGVQMAPSTANSVLRRHGLIDPAASRAATAWHRFEHEAPNALWQMDFKGHFAMDSGRCHPLTVLDDHSRFNIVLHALDCERREPVRQRLQQAFEHFGLPERINADNGPPWGAPMPGALTTLGVWLIRLGVKLSHSRPLHPQTNGKDERFHRTLAAEVLRGQHFKDLPDVQRRFDPWRHEYNAHRPHEAIGMHTPASRYRASPGQCLRRCRQWNTARATSFTGSATAGASASRVTSCEWARHSLARMWPFGHDLKTMAASTCTSAITVWIPSTYRRTANLPIRLSPMSSHGCHPCPRSIQGPPGGSDGVSQVFLASRCCRSSSADSPRPCS